MFVLPQRIARKLLREYLAGRVEVDEAATRLAPLSLGMSLIDLTEGALASLGPSGKARMAALLARLPQRPAVRTLHVRRLQLVSPAAPADSGVPNEKVVSVDVIGLDADRDYKASLALRVREAAGEVFENSKSWYWDRETLVVPKASAQIIQEALSEWNRSTTNDSWLDYCSALRSRVGEGAITQAT
jgi:hypothetical protein